MSRLTKKIENGYGTICNSDTFMIVDMTQKLGKLEDLEDELVCPLEVVNKALKNGIFNNCNEHYVVGLTYILGSYMFTCFDEKGNVTGSYPLKEYRKTWCLKKSKEE